MKGAKEKGMERETEKRREIRMVNEGKRERAAKEEQEREEENGKKRMDRGKE